MKQTVKWTLILAALLFAAVAVQAQVIPPDCPNICTHEYALCIAASCDEQGNCGQCDSNDGSCGYCYVFQGQSCSYGTSCAGLMPSGNIVYSTYSEILSSQFGFKVMEVEPGPGRAQHSTDCMDARCTLTGNSVTLTDIHGQQHSVPTAVCGCRLTPAGGGTLGGNCNAANQRAIWSTAGGVLTHEPHCAP